MTAREAFDREVIEVGIKNRDPILVGSSLIIAGGYRVLTIVYSYESQRNRIFRWATYLNNKKHASAGGLFPIN